MYSPESQQALVVMLQRKGGSEVCRLIAAIIIIKNREMLRNSDHMPGHKNLKLRAKQPQQSSP